MEKLMSSSELHGSKATNAVDTLARGVPAQNISAQAEKTSGLTFQGVLDQIRGNGQARFDNGSGQTLLDMTANRFGEFFTRWRESEHRLGQLTRSLSGESRNLFEAQRLVNRLQLESELFTRAADAFASGLRRLHQMGSN